MHYFADGHLEPTPVMVFKFAPVRREGGALLPLSPSGARMLHRIGEYFGINRAGLESDPFTVRNATQLVRLSAMEKSPGELRDQFGHWGDNPVHSVSEWKQEVQADNTRLGYWEWVATLMEGEEEAETIRATEDAAPTR